MVSSEWVGGISSWFKNAVDKKGTIIHTSLYIHISTHMKQSVNMCGEVQSSVTITLQPRAHCAVEYWSKETVCVGTTASQGDWRQDTALLPRADFCQSQQTEILLLLLWSLVEPQECVLASLLCWNPADMSFDLLPWRLLHLSHECWVQGRWSDFLRSGWVLSVALLLKHTSSVPAFAAKSASPAPLSKLEETHLPKWIQLSFHGQLHLSTPLDQPVWVLFPSSPT